MINWLIKYDNKSIKHYRSTQEQGIYSYIYKMLINVGTMLYKGFDYLLMLT